ncbi:MAG: PIN domain-containing protein, partial [Verrucomicrobiota bacterium]
MPESVLEATGANPHPAKAPPPRPPRSTSGGANRIKNYILDTNVLLHDPHAILNFEDNHVLVPIEVIEEVDKFKRETTERGQNARQISRMLDRLRGEGSLAKGVSLPNGGVLRIVFRDEQAAQELLKGQPGSVDSRILSQALAVAAAHKRRPTILVTKDI